MSQGQQINGAQGDGLPPINRHGNAPGKSDNIPNNPQTSHDPKHNAAVLFEGRWHESQASEVKNKLATQIFDTKDQTTKRKFKDSEILLSRNWDSVINSAKKHPDMSEFHDKPKEFWDRMKRMSEVRIVRDYSKPDGESRAVSRYGELLLQFSRSGESLASFIQTLPPAERNVFHARFLINQIFGANELFIGSGIALDSSGEFPLQSFLATFGKSNEFLPHSLLGLIGTTGLTAENLLALANGIPNSQVSAPATNAAMLGLTLALYQNPGVMLSLNDVAFEILQLMRIPNEHVGMNLLARTEYGKAAEAAKLLNELTIAAALIGSAFQLSEKRRKAANLTIDKLEEHESEATHEEISVGAKGAIFGAAIGLAAPLAENKINEVLGFAAGMVVGLCDGGLKRSGGDALVSIVVNGLQGCLEAIHFNGRDQGVLEANEPLKQLNAPKAMSILEFDLQERLFANRMNTIMAS